MVANLNLTVKENHSAEIPSRLLLVANANATHQAGIQGLGAYISVSPTPLILTSRLAIPFYLTDSPLRKSPRRQAE